MKKLLILTSLLISGSLWASPMDKICLVETSTGFVSKESFEHIYKNCERNNILEAMYLNEINLHILITNFCRFDRNVEKNITEAGWMVSCVLYSHSPKEIIKIK